MKINKLYTLSQIIDKINNHTSSDSTKLTEIRQYHRFLKKPLRTEIFVNVIPNEKDSVFKDGDLTVTHKNNYKWRGAESKVIFKNVDAPVKDGKVSWIIIGKVRIYDNSGFKFKSLNDLAEFTKGELELENLEL